MPAFVPSDGIIVCNVRLAIKTELEKKRTLNLPIARFDPKSGKVYMDHAVLRPILRLHNKKIIISGTAPLRCRAFVFGRKFNDF